ncbi:MAG: hypothetical protein ACR2OW_01330 [Methyloligellaceae bacterium]
MGRKTNCHLVILRFLGLLGILGLSACANSGSTGTGGSGGGGTSGAGPVLLSPGQNSGQTKLSVRAKLDSSQARRAIDNYRINRNGKSSPYQFTGADLNGDGRAEILVYFTGENWCAKTGCTLAVLTPSNPGYRTVTTIKRVKLPIMVGLNSKNGWRNLIVKSGGGGIALQNVTLEFSGNGYPGNATLVPGIPSDVQLQGEVLFAEGGQGPVQLGGTGG